MARLLLIEDSEDVIALIAHRLRVEDFTVLVAKDGLAGLSAARQDRPDLVILDRSLPGLDGIEVLRRLRQTSDVPVIILTGRGETIDRIEGLESGANDYLSKPFDVGELVARIRAQLRSRLGREPSSRFEVANLLVDIESRQVFFQSEEISMSPKEFNLLARLLRNLDRVQERGMLMTEVWGFDFDGTDNILDVYIRHLRRKLAPFGLSALIQTVRGVGYVIRNA